ncbi:MAG: hypothetical protein UW12_C0009G0001 [Parcubacteria group bacterium GW2011_GWF1_43_9]|nr:MAG: hypothetical protein UW12_C0009G0001 [Parcubacteria group bacterium GW2011_GWF1_43_9]
MEISDEKFNKVRQIAEQEYNKIAKVRCPYFDDFVHFNTIGFEHLLFKEWNKTRTRVEQYMRLRLLKLAPAIITASHTLQDYDEKNVFVRQKTNSQWTQKMKLVKYYGFVAIINEARIKIIVKEIVGGAKFFYSLYPCWKVTKNNDQKRKILYTGNLELD